MFDDLTKRFSRVFSGFGSGKLTEKNIDAAVKEVRQALLEADVNVRVVKGFIERVREQAVGLETIKGIKPQDQFVKIVKDELELLLGGELGGDAPRIKWASRGPTVIMMVGLQGTGKTTTTAKIARYLVRRENKKPLLVAADVQRPAAIEQLKVLGRDLELPVYFEEGGRPPKICRRGVAHATETGRDVVLLDTAGRNHIDDELMDELEDIRDRVKPDEIWLVVDNMVGQDAVVSAKEFDTRLDVTGIVLTKTDGDARGGVALSLREVTGKPIRYIGTGEKLDKLEAFIPERMAGRILGMGDVVSLVEEAQEVVDQDKAQEVAERLFLARFTLDDLRSQLENVRKMGGMGKLLDKMPGMANIDESQLGDVPKDEELGRMIAVIESMTPAEREDPKSIHMQRRHRIAKGSGTSVNAVAEVVKAWKEMNQQVKKLKSQGMLGKMAARGLQRGKKKQLKELKKKNKNKKRSKNGKEFGGWFQ